MSKVKTKELIICIISLIILALAITTNVFATTVDNINELLGNNTNEFNDIENENVLNNTTNDVTNNSVNNVVNNTINNVINNSTNNVTNNSTNNVANNNTAMPNIYLMNILILD